MRYYKKIHTLSYKLGFLIIFLDKKLSFEETDFLGTLTFNTLPFGHIDFLNTDNMTHWL